MARHAKGKTRKGKHTGKPSKKRLEGAYTHADNDGLKQLRVYEYPFSRATFTPKIPDGSCSLSNGIQFRNVLNYNMRAYPAGGMKECWIALYPGMTSSAVIWSERGDMPLNEVLPDAYVMRGVLPHTVYNEYSMAPSTGIVPEPNPAQDPNGNGLFSLVSDHNLTHWRLVSSAMRVKNLNNSDENGGWWEAVRITIRADGNYFKHEVSPITAGRMRYSLLNPSEVMKVLNSRSWPEDPSYQTGKMTELGKYEFQLRPTDTDHEFKSLKNKYSIYRETEGTYTPYAMENGRDVALVEFPEGVRGVDNTEFGKDHLDDQYDIIVLHVLGVENTQLLVESVSNQEVLASSESTLVRFMSECADAGDNLKRIQKKNRVLGTKPGVVRATVT